MPLALYKGVSKFSGKHVFELQLVNEETTGPKASNVGELWDQ